VPPESVKVGIALTDTIGDCMKCPHCAVAIHVDIKSYSLGAFPNYRDGDQIRPMGISWTATMQRCPACNDDIITVFREVGQTRQKVLVAYPQGASRPISDSVGEPFRTDFEEACKVIKFSPKASAALSRRNLQNILREKAGTKSKDLYDQIEEVIAAGKIPSNVADDLHAVRVIGNFAAHPMKSTNTGEIVEVEAGEAEWNLDVLEGLFDLYFVQPALSAKRKADLNKKLTDAGKPPLA
jgi:Domain of unknown function (DUF4145)